MGTEISGYILNRGSGMMQYTTFTGAETSRYILNRSSGMMQSYHFHGGRDLWIHFEPRFRDDAIHHFHRGRDLWINFEPKFKDDAILPLSRGLRPPDTLNQNLWMMQSHFILEDRGLHINLGQVPRDDTIPLHSRIPRSPDHFWASAQGWYNPTTFSMTEVTESLLDIFLGMVLSLFILED